MVRLIVDVLAARRVLAPSDLPIDSEARRTFLSRPDRIAPWLPLVLAEAPIDRIRPPADVRDRRRSGAGANASLRPLSAIRGRARVG